MSGSSRRQANPTAWQDSPSALLRAPSTTGVSTRLLYSSLPSLTSLCVNIFAENFVSFHRDEEQWRACQDLLKILPDNILSQIFSSLKAACPTYLRHEVIVVHFLRGKTISLTNELTGVKQLTISSLSRLDSTRSVQNLKLTGFETYADSLFATAIKALHCLRTISFAGCSKVGSETMLALSKTSPSLESLNVNFTTVSPTSLIPILQSCKCLSIIKAAGISSWSDVAFSKLSVPFPEPQLFESFTSLKICKNSLSEISLQPFLARCPNLKRLDLSFTNIRRSPFADVSQLQAFEKLNLTATSINESDLVVILTNATSLHTLSLASFGTAGKRASLSANVYAFPDPLLDLVTAALKTHSNLRKLNFAGNVKLGASWGGSLRNFISTVGQRCTHLNLALTTTRSEDFSLPGVDGVPNLRVLNLNNTLIDDTVFPWISSCGNLSALEIAQTKVTEEGVLRIIDACPFLDFLNLTGCRGIKVVDRRRFFQVWTSQKV